LAVLILGLIFALHGGTAGCSTALENRVAALGWTAMVLGLFGLAAASVQSRLAAGIGSVCLGALVVSLAVGSELACLG
jgi:hypothetical protein